MKLRLLTVLALLALASTPPVSAEEVELTILHTTDVHGALVGHDDLADRPASRGLARVATVVERVRAEGRPVLLVDAGDMIQGSPLASVYHSGDPGGAPEPMMAAMSRMGYDAMAVGNHEFNHGLEAIARARRDARFPWLAANIVGAARRPMFRPSIVKTLAGVRVGVIGVCTPAVPSWEDSAHIAGLRFLSPVESARHEVERLRSAERCDVIVLVAHTGLERDLTTGAERPGDTPDENWGYRLATEVTGLDALVLGHTHVLVPGTEIGGVLVGQAGKWAEHLGRMDLTLERDAAGDRWRVRARRGRVIAMADTIPEHPAILELARPYRDRTQRVLDEVIGQAETDLASPDGRFGDGPLWELIHRAQLEASGAEVSLAALFDPEARIGAGPITVRDVMRLYVYDNTLAAVELTGAELGQVLEHSARYLDEYTWEAGRPLARPGMPGYNFDSAEGVSYTIDLTRPPGDRVRLLSVRGAPLDPTRRLRVAVNNYRRNGGGGFEPIRRARAVWSSRRRLVRDLLIEHVRRRGTLDGRFDRNWTLLPDYASTPERPLIDRMVRTGRVQRDEVWRGAHAPGRRGDLAWWLARAFDWRERRLSGAWPDVPDSLAPWLDGLLRRGVLRTAGSAERFGTWERVSLTQALDWCEGAARSAGYALGSKLGDPSFRRGLLAGVLPHVLLSRGAALPDTLTRSQVLGIVANTRFPTVRILGTTDFHGAILGARERRTDRPIGGSAVLAAHLRRLAAENPEGTVLVDGGDCFQGTMISNLAFGRPVVEQMNALGYTATAIGNHEFDWTVDTLVRRVHEMRFAALGANLAERRNGRRPKWAGSDTVVVRRGVRVGIFGLCYRHTPDVTLPSNVEHLRFEDDSATAARIVPRLRRRARADAIIGIGHVPTTIDSAQRVRGDLARLARGVRGVDAWLGGHSHNQVATEVNGIPTLIAGSHGQVIAVCDLAVDPVRDRVIERQYRLVTTYADEVEPDSAMQALVTRWNADVGPLAAHPVGLNAHHLGRTRGGESMVGNLVTDAIRSAVEADVALQNNGGLRADLPAGQVTWGMIYEVMPFENTVVTMRLTGGELRRVLEEGLRFERVTQVSGIHYSFDLGATPLSRVVSLALPDGSPLNETRSYRVACNNFMAEGGDNYETLSRARDRLNTGLAVRDLLAEHVHKLTERAGTVDYQPEGRVVRVPGSPPPARGD